MIKLKEYIKLRELLHASEEDYEVACENIKNLKLSDIVLMMFAKSLMFGTRQAFCQKFEIDYHSIKEWNEIFKDYSIKDWFPSLCEKEIIEYEVHEQMVPIFKNTWSFINNVDIKLNWNGHTG
tara:strand:- start:757 stop:1125 length:369 start_codon:yes stop_codon:yes gene_type:complete